MPDEKTPRERAKEIAIAADTLWNPTSRQIGVLLRDLCNNALLPVLATVERLEGEQRQTNATLTEHSTVLGELIQALKAGRGERGAEPKMAEASAAPVPLSPPATAEAVLREFGGDIRYADDVKMATEIASLRRDFAEARDALAEAEKSVQSWMRAVDYEKSAADRLRARFARAWRTAAVQQQITLNGMIVGESKACVAHLPADWPAGARVLVLPDEPEDK